jgi:tetraacyldisaccharide 4'-kinase
VSGAAAILTALYTRLGSARRRAYGPAGRSRRLQRPVISVGNVAVGGRGKTPVVARIATLLVEAGERPAVLSRGYGRRDRVPGVVVVSDGTHILADLDRAGDEPLMLARALDGVGVFVSPDRFWAGSLAERRFGASVHVLDDGFQHVGLERDVDLVLVDPADEADRPLPSGRLREPLTTLVRADAIIVPGVPLLDARELAARWQVAKAFTVTRTPAVPRLVDPWGAPPRVPRSAPVVAMAGIAAPERFFDALERDGWTVRDRIAFPDHHRFKEHDLAKMAARVRETGAELVLTTEKDAVRLLALRPMPVPIAWVPVGVSIAPEDEFDAWLRHRLVQARTARHPERLRSL